MLLIEFEFLYYMKITNQIVNGDDDIDREYTLWNLLVNRNNRNNLRILGRTDATSFVIFARFFVLK